MSAETWAPGTERAYRAYRTAAERGYGNVRVNSPSRMARIDARIRALKARYEALLARDKRYSIICRMGRPKRYRTR